MRDYVLFNGLTEEERAAIEARLIPRTFGKGVFIYHRGSPGHNLYFVQSGRVRSLLTSDAGREITLDFFGPGDVFGLAGALNEQTRRTTAAAVEPSVVLTLQREDVLYFSNLSPVFTRNLLEEEARNLRSLTDYIYALAFLGLNGRLAAAILQLARQADDQAGLQLTQTDLANWVAASRGRVNRVLASFREMGLIEMDGSGIRVLDWRGLQQLAQG